jgi:hypothetical protein
LVLSASPSRDKIASLSARGNLDRYPKGSVDLYDLAEGYRQRGAYRFVRGDLERAGADFETAREIAREIEPSRTWVRFHGAGRSHVPNPLDWHVDERLTLAGWEARPGFVTLYWLTSEDLLVPSYRTTLHLSDPTGLEMGTYVPEDPDPWRALANEIVRVTHPLTWMAGTEPLPLTVVLYPADGAQPLGSLEIVLDAE